MIYDALLKGLIWSVLWILYVYMLLKCFPWEMVHEYPDDIKEKTTLKEPNEEEKKRGKRIGGAYSVALFAILAVFPILYFRSSPVSFWTVFFYTWIIAFTWNVIDLVVMDWLFVCTLTPDWIVLPGTKGCKGYKDYGFHFKGFLLGCIYISLTALIMAGIAYAVLHFLVWA
ncbi:MAG: hypothetical protein IJ091_09305 [Oscillospiraceae bacterium]|nr:hypothetical protein [Oscillospiraceae bacterium]